MEWLAENAQKLFTAKKTFVGNFVKNAASYAVAVAETNAAMGKIAACPTAGSCGIVPGALIAAQNHYGYDDEKIVRCVIYSNRNWHGYRK